MTVKPTTKRQATQVLAAIKRKYKPLLADMGPLDQPRLCKFADTPYMTGLAEHWCVMWEAGPYEWACGDFREVDKKAHVFTEPYCSFILGVFPEW